ncbi:MULTISPECIES: hypothetical protein [Pseudomonas]|uniref:Glycosyltransferase RgtA/B/C/D-like domain-containing protein n=1 Tax=Pseudomonas aphyarum TaxID=2942629 RepID=A0ABT5PI89_9PSED|nr:hypothetical protein [Pseudomonas aphyarum]MDD0970029.1 hypothetical protein [Pseudomonas aphyarum]MDD1123435.1 hypothetical protein [Pseudomonas aphyarum]
MKVDKLYLPIVLCIYFVFSLTTLALWERSEVNTLTGDEPHYLVMASGIAKHHTFEQTLPYKEEFATKEIFKWGMAAANDTPAPANTHATLGPHGLYNYHNVGLPLLLALPFVLGGIIGAKLFLIFCGALVVLVVWKVTGLFSPDLRHRFFSTLLACVSLPLIPAANQVYPDMLGGLLSALGLYWFYTAQQRRGLFADLLLACAIAFLPWLQIKLAATCVILILGVSARIYQENKEYKRVLGVLLIAGISCMLLASYNYYAFGKVSGPYVGNALEISKTSFMVFLGLIFDQNQGFLFQNPVNLIGVLALGEMFRRHRQFTLVWGLVFLSLIVPNAMHPAWYGGASFSGRFGWSAQVVFYIPVVYGLLQLSATRVRVFGVVVALCLAVQAYLFYKYAIDGVDYYNRGQAAWITQYSAFYVPVRSWLPMLYNSDWAYGYLLNYAWFAIVSLVLLLGFTTEKRARGVIKAALVVALVVVVCAGFKKMPHSSNVVYLAKDLPSFAGTISGNDRVVSPTTDKAGLLVYGPYKPLGQGKFKLNVRYSSVAPESQQVDFVEVSDAMSGVQLQKIELAGTNGNVRDLDFHFQVTDAAPNKIEFRIHWKGESAMTVQSISLREI